jgi:hypothetical protein
MSNENGSKINIMSLYNANNGSYACMPADSQLLI